LKLKVDFNALREMSASNIISDCKDAVMIIS